MKKYPKILAEMEALRDAIQYLYERAEELEEAALNYKKRITNGEDDEWLKENISEYEAKTAAYIKLAEKLGK